MPATIVESCIYPFRIATGKEQVAFAKCAVDKVALFNYESFALELLVVVASHGDSLSGEGGNCTTEVPCEGAPVV